MNICLKTVAANDFLHDRRDALGTAPGLAEAGGPEEEAARGRICTTSPPCTCFSRGSLWIPLCSRSDFSSEITVGLPIVYTVCYTLWCMFTNKYGYSSECMNMIEKNYLYEIKENR